MREPVLRLGLNEVIVDSFAGGGGTSVGIHWALGRPPDYAINHDPVAIAMHAANHPQTRHLLTNVLDVDFAALIPLDKRVGLFWLSPDCTYHSPARGGKPFRHPDRAMRKRGLCWVACKAVKQLGSRKPRIIILENVREFADWGPLGDDGRPDPERAGITFQRFVRQLENLGYKVDYRDLVACDYGAPTSRRRLFLVARCDGHPIVWPEATHGPGRPYPWRTAADCMQWEIPCPSIFEREKPLAENTERRIARGYFKFVHNAAEPYIVPVMHSADARVHSIYEPMRTITAAHRGDRALVAAFLAKHNAGFRQGAGVPLSDPIHTITSRDHHALSTSHLVKLKGTCAHGQAVTRPMPTVGAQGLHLGEVRGFIIKYYSEGGQWGALGKPMGTLTTRDRLGLVTVRGELHVCVDIGMRMLVARELYRGNGFPDSYQIAPLVQSRRTQKPKLVPLSQEGQVDMCGNAVPPQMAEAIVRAQFVEQREEMVA